MGNRQRRKGDNMNEDKKTHQRGNADGMVTESGEAVRFSDNGVETVIRKDGITITNRTGRELTAHITEGGQHEETIL